MTRSGTNHLDQQSDEETGTSLPTGDATPASDTEATGATGGAAGTGATGGTQGTGDTGSTGATEGATPAGVAGATGADEHGESQGDLVERLRRNVVELLAEVVVPPRALRMRAGEVSVDVEWADEQAAPPGPGPEPGPGAAASPGGPPSPGVHAPPPAAPSAAADPSLRYVTAPTVGTFYRAPEPGAPPFVREGDTVAAGQQVAIVEAMKLMIAVMAEVDGRVVEVLKSDGEAVEYGERLIALTAGPEAG